MMGRALLIIGALATLGFVASGVLGYLLESPADAAMKQHMLVALAACLAQLFSHCWILIYLIFTGRAIRETVEERGLDARYAAEAGRFAKPLAPWLLAAIALGMATFLLGGATATGAVRPWIHHGLFFLTLAVQGWALWREHRVLGANQRLIDEIDGRLAGLAAPAASGQEVMG
jgi:RsiW-degrading membrane proteinase PrsW (M82 family)